MLDLLSLPVIEHNLSVFLQLHAHQKLIVNRDQTVAIDGRALQPVLRTTDRWSTLRVSSRQATYGIIQQTYNSLASYETHPRFNREWTLQSLHHLSKIFSITYPDYHELNGLLNEFIQYFDPLGGAIDYTFDELSEDLESAVQDLDPSIQDLGSSVQDLDLPVRTSSQQSTEKQQSYPGRRAIHFEGFRFLESEESRQGQEASPRSAGMSMVINMPEPDIMPGSSTPQVNNCCRIIQQFWECLLEPCRLCFRHECHAILVSKEL